MLQITFLSPCIGDNLNLNQNLTNGIAVIRTFDPVAQSYKVVANMDQGRWYPTVGIMADGNVLIVGGMQQVGNEPLNCFAMSNSIHVSPTMTYFGCVSSAYHAW